MSEERINGKMHPSGTMFLRTAVGEAESADGKNKYEMSTSISGSSMIVRSGQTGKYFTVHMMEVLEEAVRQGIDIKDEEGAADGQVEENKE